MVLDCERLNRLKCDVGSEEEEADGHEPLGRALSRDREDAGGGKPPHNDDARYGLDA